jgi:hypothetical protein
MQSRQLLEELVLLAREAGLEVREMRGAAGGEGGLPAPSGVCRVRDGFWVMLAESDSVEHRIEVVAGALTRHAAPFLASRYLPPAIRERLEGGAGIA